MRSIQWSKPSWVKTPTAWQQAQLWRQKRQLAFEQFQNTTDSFVAGVATAQADEISGSTNIAIQLAVTRIQAAGKAKVEQLQKQLAASRVNRIA
jgi:hypothetical protein